MRLVVASDTHEQHGGLNVPDGDIFIHAGDLTFRGDLPAIADFGAWVQRLPHRHKVIIAGNHDWAFVRKPTSARAAIGEGTNGVVYLQDAGLTIDGRTFWGSPWQPWFYDWAFNLRRGPELAEKWALIPSATEILITHGPPLDILDAIGNEHVGCADLLSRVRDICPRVHIFGHIHEGSGIVVQGGTTYVNASICDAEYKPTNPVRVIDI